MSGSGCPLAKGERVVFLGDSITEAGGEPNGYVTLVADALAERCPDLGVEVLNAGISGNKVPDLVARLQRDVLDREPTLVVIYIGINDVWHWAMEGGAGTSPAAYEEGLRDVLNRIGRAGARVLLCTPSVIGERPDGTNAQDEMLERFVAISRRVAAELDVPLHDLHEAFLTHLRVHNAAGRDFGILTTDGVHLNDAGNRFVADQMLQALGAGAD